jgi:hypothetical protein
MQQHGLRCAMAERSNGPRPGWPDPAGVAPSTCPAMVTVHHVLVVARRVQAHRWLARDKVFTWSISAESGRRRARRGPVGLIKVAARQRGGRIDAGQRCSGVGDELRWSPEGVAGA